jgi:hydrophobic/amphiphilic exporter-1 (mainly G- bacteria), HAE1 family
VGPKEIIARTMGEVTGIEELGRIVVASDGHQSVLLADVATIVDDYADKRVSARFNGREAVRISVLKSAEANIVEVADAVNRQLELLRPVLPEGIELGYVEDQSVYVRQALIGVSSAAIAAAVLLIIVIYLFHGSLRQVAVMLIALPLTLIINFALMKVAGFSLNIFSLGGLVVAIGVVLDNSVVVLENITRLHRAAPGDDIRVTSLTATTEVSPALIAATLSFLALFVPFLLVPGLASLLFRELILVIAGIVVVSLLVALTMTPLLATLFIHSSQTPISDSLFERFFNRVADGYAFILDWAVRWRLLVVALFVVILAGAALLSGRLGGEFLPLIDDGQVMIRLDMPTGAAVAQTDRTLQRIEERLAEDPLIATIFTFSGGQVMGMTTREVAHRGEIYIQLIPRSQRDITTGEYAADLRRRLNSLQPPGGRAIARQVPIRGIPGIRSADVIVKVRGPDLNRLAELTGTTTRLVAAVEGFGNVRGGVDLTKPEFQVHIDRAKAATLGVSVADVSRSLRTLITGAVPSRLRDGEQYYDIRVLLPRDQLAGRQDLENLLISSRAGGAIRLRDIATVDLQSGPLEILREDQLKQITVEADIADSDLAGAVKRLDMALGEAELPPGYSYDLGGSAEMMLDMKRAVVAVLVFSLFFSFIVLTVQFNSFKLPLVILASVPVCFVGVVLLMYQLALPLGATVIIGILVVVAATVNDGVLLLTYAGDIGQQEQLPPRAAVVKAARIRFRPRVMTTVTTITGFVPLALNLSDGGDMLQPMAVAAIGGLGMEMLVALFLMPCLYVMTAK